MVHLFQNEIFMGWLAVAIMLAAYASQLWKTWLGRSEPHPIAWFGFGLLTGVGYLVQIQEGAASGSWVMGFTSIFCFLVGGLSMYKKRWRMADFSKWDWGALVAGLLLFVFYLSSKTLSWGPFLSAILATSADVVLYIPIFRRTWSHPVKETATAYGLNSLKFIPSLFAMGAYSIATCLYPATLIVVNASVVVWLVWRRRMVAA